jgi:hypothetical protein
MRPDNPLPSGEGAPDYYDRLFGDRIRRIRKGTPPPAPRVTGGGNAGRGIGIIVAVLVLGFFRILSSDRSFRHSSPDFTAPRFQVPDRQRLEQMAPVIPEPRPIPFPAQPAWPLQDDRVLSKEDVPLVEGLCYRIYQESRQAAPRPGHRIWALLDAQGRELVRRGASGVWLDPPEQDCLFAALNAVLARASLYDRKAFQSVRVPLNDANVHRLVTGVPLAGQELALANRALLEAAYPAQILPRLDVPGWDDPPADQLRRRARADLERWRRQFEPRR